jgi:hypothetical protein
MKQKTTLASFIGIGLLITLKGDVLLNVCWLMLDADPQRTVCQLKGMGRT